VVRDGDDADVRRDRDAEWMVYMVSANFEDQTRRQQAQVSQQPTLYRGLREFTVLTFVSRKGPGQKPRGMNADEEGSSFRSSR
jgi:hypothetical protein